MHWVYLSPHFDDVALSCGGLAWEQAQSGHKVSIWTICAGEAPRGGLSPFAQALHERWGTGGNAPTHRRQEDIRSCQLLGASYHHLSIPDCIYRQDPATGEFMYASEEALNGSLHPGDQIIAQSIQEQLERLLDEEATLVYPLALGSHVDHQLTRSAAEALHRRLWYYADYPYVLRNKHILEAMRSDRWIDQAFVISVEGIAAWQKAIAVHASQISTFWVDTGEMKQAISDYVLQEGGVRLWMRPHE